MNSSNPFDPQQSFNQQGQTPQSYPNPQPYPNPQSPSGPPMNGGNVPSSEPSKKNWFARHKVWTGIGAVAGLFIIIGIASGGSGEDPNDSAAPAKESAATEPATDKTTETTETTDTSKDAQKPSDAATEEPAKDEPAKDQPKQEDTKKSEPAGPKIGDVAKAGDMTYKVVSVKQATRVGGKYLNETAKGTYLVVKVEVTNNSDESVFVDDSYFTLMSGSKKFQADSTASIYANTNDDGENSSFFLENLNPELSLTGVVVFDVSDKVANAKDNVLRAQTGFWGTETVDISLTK